MYNSIIEAIALGNTKLNEISGKTGESKDKVHNYIMSLIDCILSKKHTQLLKKAVRVRHYISCAITYLSFGIGL